MQWCQPPFSGYCCTLPVLSLSDHYTVLPLPDGTSLLFQIPYFLHPWNSDFGKMQQSLPDKTLFPSRHFRMPDKPQEASHLSQSSVPAAQQPRRTVPLQWPQFHWNHNCPPCCPHTRKTS